MPLTVSEISFRNPRGAGRPKGVKNRPKWLLKELKKLPKRPRGRPKGYSPKNPQKPPTDLQEWLVTQAATNPRERKPAVPELKRGRGRIKGCKGKATSTSGQIAKATPEQRQKWIEKARKTRAQTTPYDKPKDWTKTEYAIFLEQARTEAKRIYKIMKAEGLIPENEMAAKSLEAAFEMVTSNMAARDKLQAIRTVLEYTKQKPASKSDITLKTAEDFLDELAEHDDNERGEAQT